MPYFQLAVGPGFAWVKFKTGGYKFYNVIKEKPIFVKQENLIFKFKQYRIYRF